MIREDDPYFAPEALNVRSFHGVAPVSRERYGRRTGMDSPDTTLQIG